MTPGPRLLLDFARRYTETRGAARSFMAAFPDMHMNDLPIRDSAVE